MNEKIEHLRWGAERRLEFIEFQAYWEGRVNRSDIRDRFGVSVPQASSDLAAYQRLAPGNLEYDSSAKCYVPTNEFSPNFMKPNPDRYLAQLRGMSDGIIEQEDTWVISVPPTDAMSIPARKVDADVLRSVVMAIRLRQSVEVEYQSMSSVHPDPLWRRITPHAFGFDGVRWHVRAFCHIDMKFKDFVLSRCYKVNGFSAPGASPLEDEQWNNFFTIILSPNPLLSHTQRKSIALDYLMVDDQLKIKIRQALLFYFIKRMRLDMINYDDNPAKNPLVVVNANDFKLALRKD